MARRRPDPRRKRKAKAKAKPKPKPKLPRGRVPPPSRAHRDEKKEADRSACRRFRGTKTQQ
jgi:hypothetical protein